MRLKDLVSVTSSERPAVGRREHHEMENDPEDRHERLLTVLKHHFPSKEIESKVIESRMRGPIHHFVVKGHKGTTLLNVCKDGSKCHAEVHHEDHVEGTRHGGSAVAETHEKALNHVVERLKKAHKRG